MSAVAAAPAQAATLGPLPVLVHDAGVVLFLSAALAVIFTALRIPAIAGYILAGIVAGPLVLGLVTDAGSIEAIAQLGFVLLLFVIGLELDFTKIVRSGRVLFVTGLFQYPIVVLFGFVVAKLLVLIGLGGLLGDNIGALYIGLTIACSSTLLVVKLFEDAFEIDTVPGRIALGLLIFEDLWAIIIIILQPSLHDPQLVPILFTLLGIGILAGIAVVTSRFMVPIAFRAIAKSPEVILVGAVAWCFATILFGTNLDTITLILFGANFHLNVSSGMGALIAGATIASLPYATEIVTKVNVIKDFFITLFFVGLGLSIPAPSGPGVLVLAVAIAAAALVARQIIVFPLLYFSGLDERNAEVTAVRIAQISEFSLVIAFLGQELGHISPELVSAIVFAFVLTALATTPLYHKAYAVYEAFKPALRALGFREPPEAEAGGEAEWRLALLGFHRVASSLLENIARNDPRLASETLVVDYNVAVHPRIRERGAHVEYGDLANGDTLRHAGVDRARVVVSTIPDDLMRGIDNRRLVQTVRRMNPTAIIIANAVTFADCAAIYEAGADYVFLGRLETARGLGGAIGQALNGTLADYRRARESVDGAPDSRQEVLR
jgi:Kef-type K+ transport system membrane component KefB/voltage-gated potassium channel Kch